MKKRQNWMKVLVSTIFLTLAFCTEAFETHSCGGVFSGYRYSISSPNYPENYPNDQDCIYVLRGSSSSEKCVQEYQLEFLDFDVKPSENCEKDFLRIEENSLFCGNAVGTRRFKGKQNGLRIVFHSDKEENGRGFKILVTVSPCSRFEVNSTENRSLTHVVVPESKIPQLAEKNSSSTETIFQNRFGVTNERPTQILESVPTSHRSFVSQISYPVFRPDVDFSVEDNVQPGRGDQPPVKFEVADNKNEKNIFPTVAPKWPVNNLEVPIYEQHNFHDVNCRHFYENRNPATSQVPFVANFGNSQVDQRPQIISYLYLPPEDTAKVPLKIKSNSLMNFTNFGSNVIRPDLLLSNQNRNVQIHQGSAELPTIFNNVENITKPPTSILLPDSQSPHPFQLGAAALFKNQNFAFDSQNQFHANSTQKVASLGATTEIDESPEIVRTFVTSATRYGVPESANVNLNGSFLYDSVIPTNCRSGSFNCDGNANFPETNVEFNTGGVVNTNVHSQAGTNFDVNTNFGVGSNPGVGNFDVNANQNPAINKNFNVNPGISIPFPTDYPNRNFGVNTNFGVSESYPFTTNFYPDNNYDFSFGVVPNSYPSANYYYPSVASGSGLFGTIGTNFNNQNTECCNTVYASQRFLITSPGFPAISHSSNPYACRYTIQKYSQNVCRLRFNFKFFYLGSEDPFCAYGFLELDGRRICGCKTGLTVTSTFSNYVTKTIGLKYLGYPRIKFNGFVIEVIQETCLNYYPRSKKDVISSDLRILSLRRDQNDTSSDNVKEMDEARRLDTQLFRNKRDSSKKDEKVNILKKNEVFFDIARDSLKPTLSIQKMKRDLQGYSYPKPAFGLSSDGRNTFLNTGSPQTSQNLFWNNCQTLVFLNWAIAAKEVYLRNAQCSRIGNSAGGMIPIIPIFPGNGNPNGSPAANCESINVIEGALSSPQYPYNYPNNVNKCYRFYKAPGYCQLELAFLDFDLETSTECFKDYVSFSGQYRRYCGTSLSGSRTIFDMSRINIADVYFVSDSSGTRKGFRAGFAQIPCQGQDRQDIQDDEHVVSSKAVANRSCGGNIRNMYFSLSSPRVSSGYMDYCVYNVYKTTKGKSILVLNFRNFILPCGMSYLEVNDQQYCGNWTGREIKSTFETPFIRIVYSADINQSQGSFCATGTVLSSPDGNPRAISTLGSRKPECILEPRGLEGLEVAPVLEPRSPKNLSCSYIFSKKDGYCVLRLKFTEFDLIDSPENCETSYLAIRGRKYCGKLLEKQILDLPFGLANTEEIPYFVKNDVDFANWRFSYKYLPCENSVG